MARLVLAGLLAVSMTSPVRAQTPFAASLAGKWQLVSPQISCPITLDVTAAGAATMRNGTRITRWNLHYAPKAQEGGWKTAATLLGSEGAAECAFPTYVEEGFGKDTYIRVFSEGRKMTLCTVDNIGGCNQWFDRVGRPAIAPVISPSVVIERAIYRAVPEQTGLFEVLAAEPMPVILMDPDPAKRFKTVDCPERFTWDVGGNYRMSFGELRISLCPDAGLFAKVGRDAGNSEIVAAIIRSVGDSADRRRYGIEYANEKRPDGSRLYAYPGGIDVAVQLNTVIWVSPGSRRAVVVQLIGMAECEDRKPYAAARFCQDRSAALRKIAIEVARTTEAPSWRGH